MKLNDLVKIDTKQMYKTYDDWPNIARQSFEEQFKKILICYKNIFSDFFQIIINKNI